MPRCKCLKLTANNRLWGGAGGTPSQMVRMGWGVAVVSSHFRPAFLLRYQSLSGICPHMTTKGVQTVYGWWRTGSDSGPTHVRWKLLLLAYPPQDPAQKVRPRGVKKNKKKYEDNYRQPVAAPEEDPISGLQHRACNGGEGRPCRPTMCRTF